MSRESARELKALTSVTNIGMLMEQINLQVQYLEHHLDEIEENDGIQSIEEFLTRPDVVSFGEMIKNKNCIINTIDDMLDINSYK